MTLAGAVISHLMSSSTVNSSDEWSTINMETNK